MNRKYLFFVTPNTKRLSMAMNYCDMFHVYTAFKQITSKENYMDVQAFYFESGGYKNQIIDR